MFEYIYFSRPDSAFDGVGVYRARLQAGRFLAMDSPVEADLVVGVPESGNAAALGYAMESGIPYGTAFVKILCGPDVYQTQAEQPGVRLVRVKLNVLKEAVAGKRVIMIDDSIVRGHHQRPDREHAAGCRGQGGAREGQRTAVPAPLLLWHRYPGRGPAHRPRAFCGGNPAADGADSLSYLRMERLKEMAGGKPICTACFSGIYPIEPPQEDIRGSYER